MVEVAGQFGVDMSAIRSVCVTQKMLHANDIIFVMEKAHRDRLIAMDTSIAGKVFLLGAHQGSSEWPAEIADPYGQSRTAYLTCYERIAEAANTIKAVIAVTVED